MLESVLSTEKVCDAVTAMTEAGTTQEPLQAPVQDADVIGMSPLFECGDDFQDFN